ncbi:MAG: Do family serine endopeptidase [Candidatus Poribacteria bacterium]|nr:Do family serine endopeptidase [Candidatus Poribacteria bacterium]
MFRLGTKFQIPVRVLLVLVALIVAAALVIDRGTDEFTLQTAIGQTNDTFEKSEDFLHLERANQAFIDLVAQTRPAVVQITTKMRQNRREEPQREQMSPEDEDTLRRFFGDDLFRRFFRERTPRDLNPNPEPFLRGLGSGVIVSDDGYILTNNHVIERADEIKVILANSKEYPAKLVGRDAAGTEVSGTDLALLKIDAEGLPVLSFGDSDALEVGEWVIAIGNPFSFSQTVTRGIVSAKGRSGGFSGIAYGNFIQTDAPINRGNSGGALINIRGELVGINTLIATGGFTMGNVGLGFAVPSNMAQQVLPQLIKNGKVERAWLGISMENVNQELTEKLNFDAPRGAHVTAVGKGSPAEKGGIQPEDVIVEFDGETVRNTSHLMLLVGAAEIGKPVDLTVLRESNREERLTVKLEKRTEEVIARLNAEQQEFFAGFQVQNLTPLYAEEYGYASDEKGVIVTGVERDSDAARKGINLGSLIQEMEWEPIDDLETYSRLANRLKDEKKEQVLFFVKSPHGQGGGYVTIKVPTSDR